MYELRGRPLRRAVMAPVGDGFGFIACISAFFVLFAGGWATVGAICWFVVFIGRTYAAGLRADATGILVTNRFLRHQTAWKDVSLVWLEDRKESEDFFALLSIERRPSLFFSISAYATLGMSRAQITTVAHELVALARQYGYDIIGGNQAEVHEQLVAARERELPR